MLKTYLFKFSLFLWFAAWGPLLLIALPSEKLTRWFIKLDASGLLWLVKIIVGIRYEIRGAARPQTIIASKHMSIMEVAVFAARLDNAFFIIKRELLMIPIYGWAFWRMGFIGVNRTKGATNMARLAGHAAKKIRSGKSLIIFPEGTRKLPGAETKLKRGLLFIAENANIKIQPVGVNTGLFWPKHGKMSGGLAEIWFERPLPPNATLDEIAASITLHSA